MALTFICPSYSVDNENDYCTAYAVNVDDKNCPRYLSIFITWHQQNNWQDCRSQLYMKGRYMIFRTDHNLKAKIPHVINLPQLQVALKTMKRDDKSNCDLERILSALKDFFSSHFFVFLPFCFCVTWRQLQEQFTDYSHRKLYCEAKESLHLIQNRTTPKVHNFLIHISPLQVSHSTVVHDLRQSEHNEETKQTDSFCKLWPLTGNGKSSFSTQ